MQHNREIEVRFLEIDRDGLMKKLRDLGAKDRGEAFLDEVIIYDADLKWLEVRKLVRVRKAGDTITLSYKHHDKMNQGESQEIEFEVSDFDKAVALMTELGLVPYRRQQKRRHTFELGDVIFDFDTWPKIPTYVEVEGHSLETIRKGAEAVGLDWSKAVMKDARWVIENVYNIPVGKMRWFTFDRFE